MAQNDIWCLYKDWRQKEKENDFKKKDTLLILKQNMFWKEKQEQDNPAPSGKMFAEKLTELF